MGYKDVDGVNYWVDERAIPALNDPFKHAAELLARDVERYLYREYEANGSPGSVWMKPEFLAWAVARFDACKSGSGYLTHEMDFDPESASITPVRPPEQRRSPTTDVDLAIRFPEPAKQAEHIDTKPKRRIKKAVE
jgi:hypothetical protein